MDTPLKESISFTSSRKNSQDIVNLSPSCVKIRTSQRNLSPAKPHCRINAATNNDSSKDNRSSEEDDLSPPPPPSPLATIGTSYSYLRPYSPIIGVEKLEKGHCCCVALPLLKQRLGYLWEKKMFTDVVFVVGRDEAKIEAHRVILASASEVFQELLFLGGNKSMVLDENGKHVLYENDFSEQSFEVFIKAMYTNEIPICLTLAMALEVFYATKKYSVVFLEDQILEHIRQLLTVSNVFEALRLSTNAIELTYLAPICWKIIEEQTSEVLEYHNDDLDPHIFARVLERDQLNMGEVELFQSAVRWSANLCKTNGLKTTGRNKRQFMEPLVKNFRFTTMTLSQFTDVVVPSRILDPKEVQQIKYVFNKGTDPRILNQIPYKNTPRTITALHEEPVMEEEISSLLSNTERWNMLSRGRDEVPKICSDSAVTAPSSGSKLYMRRGTKSSIAKRRGPCRTPKS